MTEVIQIGPIFKICPISVTEVIQIGAIFKICPISVTEVIQIGPIFKICPISVTEKAYFEAERLKEALAVRATNPRLVKKTETSALYADEAWFGPDEAWFGPDEAWFGPDEASFGPDEASFSSVFFPSTLLFPVRHFPNLIVTTI